MIPEAYYIVGDFGRLGRETIIDWERCSRADVIHALLTGQIDRPLEVHCIDRDNARWRDASFEIAEEIIDKLDHVPHGALFDFLEHALGCWTMADFVRELEDA